MTKSSPPSAGDISGQAQGNRSFTRASTAADPEQAKGGEDKSKKKGKDDGSDKKAAGEKVERWKGKVRVPLWGLFMSETRAAKGHQRKWDRKEAGMEG